MNLGYLLAILGEGRIGDWQRLFLINERVYLVFYDVVIEVCEIRG